MLITTGIISHVKSDYQPCSYIYFCLYLSNCVITVLHHFYIEKKKPLCLHQPNVIISGTIETTEKKQEDTESELTSVGGSWDVSRATGHLVPLSTLLASSQTSSKSPLVPLSQVCVPGPHLPFHIVGTTLI